MTHLVMHSNGTLTIEDNPPNIPIIIVPSNRHQLTPEAQNKADLIALMRQNSSLPDIIIDHPIAQNVRAAVAKRILNEKFQ